MGKSDIISLVQTGSYEDIKAAIKRNGEIVFETSGKNKDTLIMTAIENQRNKEIIDLLLKSGVKVSQSNKIGQTPLMYACQFSDDEDIIREMITANAVFGFQKKARILTKDKNGKTAFDYAIVNNNKKALTILVSYVPEPTNKTSEIQKVTATVSPSPPVNTNTVVESKENSTVITSPPASEPQGTVVVSSKESSHAPEEQAASSKNISTDNDRNQPEKDDAQSIPVVRSYRPVYLFDFESDNTTIQTPAYKESKPISTNLSESDLPDKFGRTPLMKACVAKDTKLIKKLVTDGININATDKDGWTALMYAVRYANGTDIVKYLVDNGADVSVKNIYGITALLTASAFSDNPEVFRILLTNRTSKENEVREAFISAISGGRSASVIQVFLNKGLPVNDIYNTLTPLMYAAENNTTTNIISLLLKNGADPSIRLQTGKTAFDYAGENTKLPRDSTFWLLNSSSGH